MVACEIPTGILLLLKVVHSIWAGVMCLELQVLEQFFFNPAVMLVEGESGGKDSSDKFRGFHMQQSCGM